MAKSLKLLRIKTRDLNFDYKETLINVMKNPANPREGIGIDEMRQSAKVLNHLHDLKGDTLTLEDADFAHLKAKVDSYHWGLVDQVIVDLIDAIDKASEAKPEAKEIKE